MPSRAEQSPLPPLSLLLLPFATWAAIHLFAAAERNAGASAEGTYIALWAAAVVAVLGALAPRPGWEAAGTALAAATAVWAIAATPTRGAVVAVVLGAGLAVALGRRATDDGAVPWWPVAAAIGTQLLFASELLLAPGLDWTTLGPLLAWPTVGGAAVSILHHRRGPPLLAGTAVAVAFAGGWTPAVVLALLALVAGEWMARPGRSLLAGAGLGLLAVGAATLLVSTRDALLLAVAAVWVAAERDRRRRLAAAGLGLLVAVVLAVTGPVAAQAESLQRTLWLVLLVPGVLGAAAGRRLAAVALLAAAPFALRYAPLEHALPLLLLGLACTLPPHGAAARLSGLWSGTLIAVAAVAAAYPWLRPQPLQSAVAVFGLAPDLPSVLLVLGAAALLLVVPTLLAPLWPRRGRSFLPAATLTLLFGAALVALPPRPVTAHQLAPVVITQEEAEWTLELDAGRSARAVLIDSFASNSAPLATGTPLAVLRLSGPAGTVAEWPLRTGIDTGEWAARRSDVASRPGFAAPAPWISWIPPGREFFAQRYRARFAIPEAEPIGPITRLEVERATDLPARVELSLFSVVLEP